MKYSIQDHTGKDCDVHIRMAEETDVIGFLEINHAYQREKLGDTQNGFLSASFTSDMFLALINSKDIIVGTENNQIISYYLVNTINKEGALERHKRVAKFLKENGVLPKECIVGLGVQALVIKKFQGSPLRKLMLNWLVESQRVKYDFF